METSIEIPNKSIFKLNEVCSLTGVKPYVLRFWESEFPEIEPISSSSGQKLYEHKDIEAIAAIKSLLFEKKMTIEQAKFELSKSLESSVDDQEESTVNEVEAFEEVKEDIQDSTNEAVEQLASETFEDQAVDMESLGRYLSELEVQKLVLAKAKLNSIIGSIDAF